MSGNEGNDWDEWIAQAKKVRIFTEAVPVLVSGYGVLMFDGEKLLLCETTPTEVIELTPEEGFALFLQGSCRGLCYMRDFLGTFLAKTVQFDISDHPVVLHLEGIGYMCFDGDRFSVPGDKLEVCDAHIVGPDQILIFTRNGVIVHPPRRAHWYVLRLCNPESKPQGVLEEEGSGLLSRHAGDADLDTAMDSGTEPYDTYI